MAEVKWIKITTNIFDDEKIKIIDSYPARDEIIVIWFKLLALAGKVNQQGMLFMSNRIPYTSDMLASIFNREKKSVDMALAIFMQFGMIEIEDNEVITIANWEKHQNVEGMDLIREQTKNRVTKYRERRKSLQLAETNECNVTSNVTVTQCNETDRDIELERDKEEEEEEERESDVGQCPTPVQSKSKSTQRHRYGSYNNVLFTDEEYLKLLDEFPRDYQKRIERLSEYMASTGKPYKNHLATIRAWARKDNERGTQKTGSKSFRDLEV